MDHPNTRKADYSGPSGEGQCAVNICFGPFPRHHSQNLRVSHTLLSRTPTSLKVELNMKDRTETLEIGSNAPDFSLAAANREGVFTLGGFLEHGPVILEFLRGTW